MNVKKRTDTNVKYIYILHILKIGEHRDRFNIFQVYITMNKKHKYLHSLSHSNYITFDDTWAIFFKLSKGLIKLPEMLTPIMKRLSFFIHQQLSTLVCRFSLGKVFFKKG